MNCNIYYGLFKLVFNQRQWGAGVSYDIDMWIVYMLLCEDGSFYIGSTNDIAKRFKDHQNGKGARYTKSHRAIKIIYQEEFSSKSDALKREWQLKKLTRLQKENLVAMKSVVLK